MVFISYARKDYYFAESLAFHLQRYRVPVFLDAKDLAPGIDWQQQLEAALDTASCVLLVASPDSVKRPAVRMEWERAIKTGRRIIVVLFRKTVLPPELTGYQRVDFRARFDTGLHALIQLLAGQTPDRPASTFLTFPPWILIITLTLLVPLLSYFALADWSTGHQGHATGNDIFLWIMLPFFAAGFLWFLCLSFLRRRMGMTHLMACFAFPAIWSIYPLLRYWIAGPANLPAVWQTAVTTNPLPMELSSALTLIGVGSILLVQPEDLLRWTPTGKAWGWYRRRRLLVAAGPDRPSPLRQITRYALLHHAVDGPAAGRLRQLLRSLGASETLNASPQDTTILLLTSRTQTPWLSQQTPQLNTNVLTIVGSRIGLPNQFEWLWKREWIDFRHWDLQRLDRRRGLLQVPEAVTNIRYPRSVMLVHHLLCALAALAFCLFIFANPDFNKRPAGDDGPPLERAELLFISAICIWGGVVAQRFLNRTVSEQGFDISWKRFLLPATCAYAISAIYRAFTRHAPIWRLLPVMAFLVAFPFLLAGRRLQFNFWFPSPGTSKPGNTPRLAAGRQWQTLLWATVYMFVRAYILGIYDTD